MKLKSLLKTIPIGQHVKVEYVGSLVYKGEDFKMGKYSFCMLDHYEVQSVSTDGQSLRIIAAKPNK